MGLSVAGKTRNGGAYPILQIWRLNGSASNEYERISEYTFPNVGCTQQPNNVWQCTVSPSIDVEVGDIIGINLPRNHMNFAAFGIYFTPSSFTSYILGSTSNTTFSVPGSTTASAQPVLTLDILKQGINNYYDDLDLILFYTDTETTTPELTTQAPTTQLETEGPATQPATQAPTTQPENQTISQGAGQSGRGTGIAGLLVGGVVGVLLLVLIVVIVVIFLLWNRKRSRYNTNNTKRRGTHIENMTYDDVNTAHVNDSVFLPMDNVNYDCHSKFMQLLQFVHTLLCVLQESKYLSQ